MATKFPVQQFNHTSFNNNEWDLTQGFGELVIGKEKPVVSVIGTHLIHGNNDGKRMVQMAQLTNSVAMKTLPTFVAGDLNIRRDLFKETNVYLPNDDLTKITCTNNFIKQGWDPKNPDPDERIDYIAQVKNNAPQAQVNVRPLGLLDQKNTQTALSDHDALVATITIQG